VSLLAILAVLAVVYVALMLFAHGLCVISAAADALYEHDVRELLSREHDEGLHRREWVEGCPHCEALARASLDALEVAVHMVLPDDEHDPAPVVDLETRRRRRSA
jgi:hypothetical protein